MATMRTTLIVLCASSTLALACNTREPEPAKPPETPRPKSNIVKISTPAPYGAKVLCTDLFDPAAASTAIGDEVTIRDRSGSEADATAVCAFMRAGEPPSSDKQLKEFEKKNMILGVLPGDEYCMISTYCGFILSPEDMKKDCEAASDRGDDSLGYPACVHETQRGVKYAYSYTVLDPDSKCKLVVQGGPSVTEEELVVKCTRLAVDSVNAENIKKAAMPTKAN